MQRIKRCFVGILMIGGLLLSACTQASTPSKSKNAPSSLEEISGSGIKRVVLTEDAAKRLGIQTVPVKDELARRRQEVIGEVIPSPEKTTMVTAPSSGHLLAPIDVPVPGSGVQLSSGQVVLRLSTSIASTEDRMVMNLRAPGDFILLRTLATPGQFIEEGQPLFEVADISEVWVRVLMNESELDRIDRSQAALVLSLDDEEGEIGLADEELEESEDDDDIEQDDDDEPGDVDVALFFRLDNAERNLSLGQHVRVKLTRSSSGIMLKIVPFSAVIYDTDGNTWVYTSSEPLKFFRQSIVIEYIEGEQAVLAEGPETGTHVVTVGAAELYGTETGVSK